MARLGSHDVNPAFDVPAPRPEIVPFTERYPWLLPAVVALAALLVGLFLASLIRQVRGRGRTKTVTLGRSKTVPPGWCVTAAAWPVGRGVSP